MHFFKCYNSWGGGERMTHKCLVFNMKVKRLREWKELYKNL